MNIYIQYGPELPPESWGQVILHVLGAAGIIGILGLLGAPFAATVINQAKRAWERHHDALLALRLVSGILKNISRHSIKSASRLDFNNNEFINKKTFQKARIDTKLISDEINKACSLINSKNMIFSIHRMMLSVRNLDIDYQRIIECLPDYGAYNDRHELEYLIEKTLYVSQISFEFHSACDRFSKETNLICDFFWAFVLGETRFVKKLNNKDFDSTMYPNKNLLASINNDFMRDEPASRMDSLKEFIKNLR